MSKSIEFGGANPVSVFRDALKISRGAPVAIVPIACTADSAEGLGVIGHAKSWAEARRILSDAGHRLVRAGGTLAAYAGDDQGKPGEAAVFLVSVAA